jgi:hypothetical protein
VTTAIVGGSSACAASASAYPTAFGAEILNLSANLVQNYFEEVSDQYYYNHPSISVKNIDYCNVTVTYTHPGQNDTINVETWLPMKIGTDGFRAYLFRHIS